MEDAQNPKVLAVFPLISSFVASLASFSVRSLHWLRGGANEEEKERFPLDVSR